MNAPITIIEVIVVASPSVRQGQQEQQGWEEEDQVPHGSTYTVNDK